MIELVKGGGGGATVLPVVAFLAGFSGKALATVGQSLRVLAALLEAADPTSVPWHLLERAHVKRLRELLSERYAPATARRHFSALRGVLREAGNLAAVDVRGPKGASAETGRALSWEEVERLLLTCTPTFRGLQLRALVAVMVYGGLRRFEVAALDFSDFDPEAGAITIRRGKGKKGRLIQLAEPAVKALKDWIELRGIDPGPLFFGSSRAHRIGESTVSYRLRALAERAEVSLFTPHDLRRTFVTAILDATGDLSAGATAAGHASVTTTQRYDRRAQRAADAATRALGPGAEASPEPEKE